MPLFSIIVPIYKTEEYLSKCIESILGQMHHDFELLLVDDGSPDHCLDICHKYECQDKRIRVFHKDNGGVSSARNLALEHATGEWVWFVDSDDYVEEYSLAQITTDIEKHPATLYVFNCRGVREEYEGPLETFLHKYYFTYILGFGPWNKLYRRNLIQEHHLHFDTQETVGEDLLFNMQYYQRMLIGGGLRVFFIGRNYYHYVDRPSSAMNKNFRTRLGQQLRLFDKIKPLLDNEVSRACLSYLFLLHLISGIQQAQKGGLTLEEFTKEVHEKYDNELASCGAVLPEFFRNENASFWGQIRLKFFLTTLRWGFPKIAGRSMGLISGKPQV